MCSAQLIFKGGDEDRFCNLHGCHIFLRVKGFGELSDGSIRVCGVEWLCSVAGYALRRWARCGVRLGFGSRHMRVVSLNFFADKKKEASTTAKNADKTSYYSIKNAAQQLQW